MGKRKTKDPRRASRKLKELLRDKPFGVGAGFSWDRSNVSYDDWDGEIQVDDDDDDYDYDDDWYPDDDEPQLLDIN